MKPQPKKPVRVVRARNPGTRVVTGDDGSFDFEFCRSVAEACKAMDSFYTPCTEGVELVLKVLEKRGYILIP